ncbi:MAG: DUF4136 domain-containing protein [Chitinophagaceae bacterium]
MKIRLHFWLAVLTPLLFAGCYPKGAEYTDDLNLVYTNYSSDFDFSTKHTYAIPDSVVKITGDVFNDPDGDGKPQFVSATYSTAILNAVKTNMGNYGWTRVDKNANPDVVLLVSAMTTTNIYYYYDWYYWDWWYPGWSPWWGWYYPGWYYPSYVTGYRSGSVFVQMVDSKNAAAAENVSVVWNSIMNGLAEGGTADITSRINTTVNQAFAQSSYLKH